MKKKEKRKKKRKKEINKKKSARHGVICTHIGQGRGDQFGDERGLSSDYFKGGKTGCDFRYRDVASVISHLEVAGSPTSSR